MAITVSISHKKTTFLRSVDAEQPSNFHFNISLELSQGEVHDFSGEVQKLSGEVPAGMIHSFQFSPNVTK